MCIRHYLISFAFSFFCMFGFANERSIILDELETAAYSMNQNNQDIILIIRDIDVRLAELHQLISQNNIKLQQLRIVPGSSELKKKEIKLLIKENTKYLSEIEVLQCRQKELTHIAVDEKKTINDIENLRVLNNMNILNDDMFFSLVADYVAQVQQIESEKQTLEVEMQMYMAEELSTLAESASQFFSMMLSSINSAFQTRHDFSSQVFNRL